MRNSNMNKETMETGSSFEENALERSHTLKSGIFLLIIACIMAAFPTVLALRGILDVAVANVIFGMVVWYIFALCAFIAGCFFIGRALTQTAGAPRKQAA